MALILAAPFMHSLMIFVRRFGAFVFFPLGLLDMSPIPAPGSFDALLIVLTASHQTLWWYYALMATTASVIGAWPSFQMGRKGGQEAIEKKLGDRRSKKIFAAFQRWGFWSMVFGALAPPPMPASAFVLAAGAMKYPWHRFLLSWTLGRVVRFGLIGWVTMRYGRHIFRWFRSYYKPSLWIVGIVSVAMGATALWFYLRERRRRSAETDRQPRDRAA
jgi:membrane protein YqaA with SNARE-associated domain